MIDETSGYHFVVVHGTLLEKPIYKEVSGVPLFRAKVISNSMFRKIDDITYTVIAQGKTAEICNNNYVVGLSAWFLGIPATNTMLGTDYDSDFNMIVQRVMWTKTRPTKVLQRNQYVVPASINKNIKKL